MTDTDQIIIPKPKAGAIIFISAVFGIGYLVGGIVVALLLKF